MGLSCECYDDYDYDYYYTCTEEFEIIRFATTCYSCKCNILPGDQVLPFDITDDHYTEVCDVKFHCEKCGEVFLNLEDLGFCIDFEDNMLKLLEEYKNNYLK